MITLLNQGIVQKLIVNMKGDKAGDAIVIRYGNAEVDGSNEPIWWPMGSNGEWGRTSCACYPAYDGGYDGVAVLPPQIDLQHTGRFNEPAICSANLFLALLQMLKERSP
jgi:hypothetical protein